MKNYVGLWFVGLIAFAAAAGCNPPADYALVGSAYVPAAHGDITVESIDRENILINITIDHLAPPTQIEARMTHYIVWFAAIGERPVRQQALEYDPETRVAQASIPTSMLEFDVQITAEASDNPTQPSDVLVASQKIREK